MKKVIVNMSDSEYEKFRFEAMHECKSIPKVISDRIFTKPFHEEVEKAYDEWIEQQLTTMMNQE
jgi:hypothetical protein